MRQLVSLKAGTNAVESSFGFLLSFFDGSNVTNFVNKKSTKWMNGQFERVSGRFYMTKAFLYGGGRFAIHPFFLTFGKPKKTIDTSQ